MSTTSNENSKRIDQYIEQVVKYTDATLTPLFANSHVTCWSDSKQRNDNSRYCKKCKQSSMNHDSVFASTVRKKFRRTLNGFVGVLLKRQRMTIQLNVNNQLSVWLRGRKQTKNIPFLLQGNKTIVMVLICSLIILILFC